jgi:hypothetical protein
MNDGGFRNRPRTNFTKVRNAMIRDPRLTLQAKGLLTLMLSFPDDWTYYMNHLQTLSENKRDSHRAALNKLIELGYVVREQGRDDRGRLLPPTYDVADYVIADGDDVRTAAGKPGAGEPPTTKTE